MNQPSTPPAQILPEVVSVPELLLIGLLVFFFAVWGYRHGLDAVIIAGLFVVFGRFAADAIAIPVGAIINMFYGIFQLFAGGRFSGNNLFAVIAGDPNVVPPLINIREPGDAPLILLGTILFVLIGYVGIRVAVKRAGKQDTWIESIFGFVGGGMLGYLALTHVLDRHVRFPQFFVVEQSEIPKIQVDAPLLVVIVLVLIVFGLQQSRTAAKKK